MSCARSNRGRDARPADSPRALSADPQRRASLTRLVEVAGPAVRVRLLAGGARGRVELIQLDGIADANLASVEHARVNAALARMARLAHAFEVAFLEPLRVLPARLGVRGDLEMNLAA